MFPGTHGKMLTNTIRASCADARLAPGSSAAHPRTSWSSSHRKTVACGEAAQTSISALLRISSIIALKFQLISDTTCDHCQSFWNMTPDRHTTVMRLIELSRENRDVLAELEKLRRFITAMFTYFERFGDVTSRLFVGSIMAF
jgi:hypothetical protein